MEACFHCAEPVADTAPILARVGDLQHPVCCIGCRAAAEWIDSLGLQDYYKLRDVAPPRATAIGNYDAWDRPQLQKLYVHRRSDGNAEVNVLIEGLRCSACSWLIERALTGIAGVRTISVNVTGKRIGIVWNPDAIALGTLLVAIARVGYTPHPLDCKSLDDVATREQHAALKRLIVAGLGMMQAMMFAIVLYAGALEGIDNSTRDFFRWIGLLVTIPVVFYSARPFFDGAWRELRARHPGMDTPVALAVALVFIASVIETLRGGAHVYFDSASMFVFLLLGGRYLEMRARHRAADVVDALARLQPATAQRRTEAGQLETIGVHELEIGDIVVVGDGTTVPADGELIGGACRVDEALLSGESHPLRRAQGDHLIAGSVVIDGPAEIRVERMGADTTLSAIVRLIGHAQRQRPRWVRYGDRAAGWFVCGLLFAALATAITWMFIDPARAFPATLAVLVVACPCAFALAVPTALARALAIMAQHGILVLKPDAVESLVRVDHFVFDKTGTLTDRNLELAAIIPLASMPAAQCLAVAARLEAGSSHPIAAAIRSAVPEPCVPVAANLRNIPGCGVEGDIDGTPYKIGSARFSLDGAGDEDAIVLADSHGALAQFGLRESLRADAAATLAALLKSGAELEILSGDSARRVAAVAERLHVGTYQSRLSAAQKLARLAELRASGKTVAVIGDGVNDAPALAGADLAVAIGGGAELAHSSADIVLAGDRLSGLVEARSIARSARRVMRQNIVWSLVYNAASVPLAAFGFVPPWLAAFGMSISSLAVIANSLRIRAAIEPPPRAPSAELRTSLPATVPG